MSLKQTVLGLGIVALVVNIYTSSPLSWNSAGTSERIGTVQDAPLCKFYDHESGVVVYFWRGQMAAAKP